MTQEELNKIVKNHQHWLNKDCKGWQSMKANLSDENLEGADLSSVNLEGADLHNVYLGGAKLYNANLSGANLRNAYLEDAKLCSAKLCNANLYGSNLRNANLYNADLRNANLIASDFLYANLCGADLRCANLRDANLASTNFSGANLRDADLKGADFRGANLRDVALNDDEKVRLGMFLDKKMIGYKKTAEDNIIELEIPEGAIVFSINKNKCRTNKAIVKKCKGIQHSTYKHCFEYKEGDIIEVKDFDLRYNVECGAGIHFFRTRNEAKNY